MSLQRQFVQIVAFASRTKISHIHRPYHMGSEVSPQCLISRDAPSSMSSSLSPQTRSLRHIANFLFSLAAL